MGRGGANEPHGRALLLGADSLGQMCLIFDVL
jgi:hypothetical protein